MNLFTLDNLFLLLTGLTAIYLLWRKRSITAQKAAN